MIEPEGGTLGMAVIIWLLAFGTASLYQLYERLGFAKVQYQDSVKEK